MQITLTLSLWHSLVGSAEAVHEVAAPWRIVNAAEQATGSLTSVLAHALIKVAFASGHAAGKARAVDLA